MNHTLSVYCGSQERREPGLMEIIEQDFTQFLLLNKDSIDKILYGSWPWVMELVRQVAEGVWIIIEPHTTSFYYDEMDRSNINTVVHDDEEARTNHFILESDFFIALPWSIWTMGEVINTSQKLKEVWNNSRPILIPSYNTRLYEMYTEDHRLGSLQKGDADMVQLVDTLDEVDLDSPPKAWNL